MVQQRSVDTRERILRAAAELFARDGYRATTLNRVARGAAVTQGAVYFHFGSKRGIAEDVIRMQHEQSTRMAVAALRRHPVGLESVVAISGTFARQILDDSIVRAGLRLSTEGLEDLPEASSKPYRDWLSFTERLIQRAKVAHQVKTDIDPKSLAEVIVELFAGIHFVSAAMSNSEDLRARLRKAWTVVLTPVATEASRLPSARIEEVLADCM